eukprot:CAMPEP_0202730878 /NCGR_PEP_ID=MMETSP1385-20130828/186860_1 /ASSEMBLY_ACC=CAM_ASM_000861 /TAXON_ID=933848 /ORGANISM="Elphidium margaritaceum" /LENGTH=582 /DNA_ID=CAMNT_0049397157 /DNA_START=34 /DNA_END=1782 /DNA_ORIENTATION=-
MSARTLFPLYQIYVESKHSFSWVDCDESISTTLTGNCHLFAMVNEEFEHIQSVLAEYGEDICHINAQVTELFFAAVPSVNFTFRDFLKFAQIDLNEIVGSVRVVNESTLQHSICIKFKHIENAQQCFLRCHGKRYMNKKNICHVLFAVKFEIVATPQLMYRQKQMRDLQYLELPLCPSCLERLDPTISNVWAHHCDQIENARFHNHSNTTALTSTQSLSPSAHKHAVASHNTRNNHKKKNKNKKKHTKNQEEVQEEEVNNAANTIVGIDDDHYSEFVYNDHYTATSAGICRCIRWYDIKCIVCMKIADMTQSQSTTETQSTEAAAAEEEEVELKCNVGECCDPLVNELWICLVCGHVGCGRFKKSHALQHYKGTAHSFCLNLTTLSIWDYCNDTFQHRLFQTRAITQQTSGDGGDSGVKPEHHNSNEASNTLQPLDGYSSSYVEAKLENLREYYNTLLMKIIEQQSAEFEQQRKKIEKDNRHKIYARKQVLEECKQQSAQCDKKKDSIELWHKIQELRYANYLKRVEFEQITQKTREHHQELRKLKEKYDKKEQILRQQKTKQKQKVQQEIESALAVMTQHT